MIFSVLYQLCKFLFNIILFVWPHTEQILKRLDVMEFDWGDFPTVDRSFETHNLEKNFPFNRYY